MTEKGARGSSFLFLERVTAAALVLVLLALGWMALTAFEPHGARFASADVEVLVILALLLATLVLVSVVAVIHTDITSASK